MSTIRIKVTKKLKETNIEETQPDHIKKTEDRLYELHREIEELEETKLNLQYKIKQYIEKLKKMTLSFKRPSQSELFQYCNNLSRASKGSLNKK